MSRLVLSERERRARLAPGAPAMGWAWLPCCVVATATTRRARGGVWAPAGGALEGALCERERAAGAREGAGDALSCCVSRVLRN